MYILKYPTRSTVSSDLGLLQMAAGYFGYLNYATTSLHPFPFTKDIVKLAQTATEKLQGSHGAGSEALPSSTAGFEISGNDGMDLCSWDEVGLFFPFYFFSYTEVWLVPFFFVY